MKVAILAPLGSAHPEVGVLALVANYLRTIYQDVWQLVCNGVFSMCDRDMESNWGRTLDHCPRCAVDQSALGRWGNLQFVRLSEFISSTEVWDSKRWIATQPAEHLAQLDFRGLKIKDLCLGTIANRFGVSEIDLHNKQQLQFLQRLMLASLRMCLATRNFNNRFRPDLTLVAGGHDFISRSFIKQSQRDQRQVALFRWEVAARSIKIMSPNSSESYSCDFMLEDITSMRPDPNTWPAELTSSLDRLLQFLDLPLGQQRLPLAR